MSNKHRKRWLKHQLKHLGLLVTILALLGGSLLLWWIISIDIPSFDSFNERVVTKSTKIYDRTGKILLYDVHENIKRQVIPFEEISKNIKNATVAIEDSEFYQHHGVKPTAILRSLWANLISVSASQGGSTITQQLVKNTVLTGDKSLTRKIKEAVLALKIERVLSKEQILNLYLNEIPYGGSIYGIEEAAQTFFRKHASDLTLAESAYLAAIPKAPTYYSPHGQHREALEQRKNLVLARMRGLNFITSEEEATAKKEKVTFSAPEDTGIKAPHFVMMVRDYLEQKYGRDAILNDGFKVTTTLDWDLERQAEEIVARYGAENVEKFKARNAAAVVIDPKTGQILALVGSRDYFDTENDGNFNIALAHRQPGSAFKPVVYATAFTKGYTPETVLFDLPTQFDTQCARDASRCYTPINYDDKYRGPMTLRNALAQSINIPAIKVLYLVGIKEAIKQAHAMGITSLNDPARYGLTLVLGGGEVSLLDLTSAYSVFAADGERHPYASILKIEDDQGQILEEYQDRSSRVLPAESAWMISSILSDNQARLPTFAPGGPLEFTDRPVAVKTGTTNDYRDAWILGYTPSIVVGAWAGNNDNKPMERKVAGLIVSPMWRALMNVAVAGKPVEIFVPPPPPKTGLKPVLRGIWQGGQNYFVDKTSGKIATEYTPPDLREERILPAVHSILHWLNPSDPNGPAPARPENDSQYALWEGPVRAWAAARGYVDQSPDSIPQVFDDVHTPENAPHFSITSPTSEQAYAADAHIPLQINYSGRYPLAQIDAFLNDSYLDSVKNTPFTIIFSPQDIDNWQTDNTLRVIVYDSARNKSEQTIGLRLSSSPANNNASSTDQ